MVAGISEIICRLPLVSGDVSESNNSSSNFPFYETFSGSELSPD